MKNVKKVIPFILITILAVNIVLSNYSKAYTVKAVAVVDDLALFMGILAMCGLSYSAIDYYWKDGYWYPTDDPTELPDRDLENRVNEKLTELWDNTLRKSAEDNGLIDSNGNCAVYGVQRSPFRFRAAVFRSQRPLIFS